MMKEKTPENEKQGEPISQLRIWGGGGGRGRCAVSMYNRDSKCSCSLVYSHAIPPKSSATVSFHQSRGSNKVHVF